MRKVKIGNVTYTTLKSASGNFVTTISFHGNTVALMLDSSFNVARSYGVSASYGVRKKFPDSHNKTFNAPDSKFQSNLKLILGNYYAGDADGYMLDLPETHALGMDPDQMYADAGASAL